MRDAQYFFGPEDPSEILVEACSRAGACGGRLCDRHAGLPIAKAKLNARIEDGFYSAESSGKTTGIAALFFGSKVESSGGGLLMPTEADAVDGMAPQVFEADF